MTKLILSLLTIAFATQSFAKEVTITYGKQNELILKSSNCQNLVREFESICSWKKQIEPDFNIPIISPTQCKKSANGQYTMMAQSCLPSFVKNYHHKRLVKSGGNCWGTALNFKDLSLKPRFVWPEEITYWMNSPVCRKLETGEKLQAGDIINVYGPEYVFQDDSEGDKGINFWKTLFPGRYSPVKSGQTGYSGFHNFLHSETYLTKNISFGKDSPSYEDRFDFHPLAEVYGRSRETECQENQSLSPYSREYNKPSKDIKGSKCDYFTIAYRCGSIMEYLKSLSLEQDSKIILEQIKTMQATQAKLFLLTTGSLSLSSREITQLLKEADLHIQEATRETGATHLI